MVKAIKPILLTAFSLIASACTGSGPTKVETQKSPKMPSSLQAIWVFDPVGCSSAEPHPYVKLEESGFSIGKAPYSTEPSSFALQKIVVERPGGRHFRVVFLSAGKPADNSEVTLVLSADSKTLRWHEKGAKKSVIFHRCG